MSVEWVEVSLRALHPDGEAVPDAAFLNLLTVEKSDGVKKVRPVDEEGAAIVRLALAERKKFEKKDDPDDAMQEALTAQLSRAGEWLAKQPADVWRTARRAGLSLDVFVGAWIDSDQFDLRLPPAFLAACGKQKLEVTITTNE